MTYTCTIWEFAGDTFLLKLQRLQNKVLRIIVNFPGRTQTCVLNVALKFQYIYDFLTCRQQAVVLQNDDNENVPNIEQGEA